MRKIEYLVYHATASTLDATPNDIKKYWENELKWKSPGYHIAILRDGTPHLFSHISKVTNGVGGYNSNSIHIAYFGGIDNKKKPIDNRTPEQIRAQIFFGKAFKQLFPKIKFMGHKDFPRVAKACPCFDVKSDLVPYVEHVDVGDFMNYSDGIDNPFFKLLQDIKWAQGYSGKDPLEKKWYDVFIESTK